MIPYSEKDILPSTPFIDRSDNAGSLLLRCRHNDSTAQKHLIGEVTRRVIFKLSRKKGALPYLLKLRIGG